ncbi:flagellar hook-basal body protein [Hydrogenimonas urashimensis]|uniref:flagellar hook-basal body protein n=1 Tax=Hydrogenimonas urashimensis TaxID=2740515 RepID=UPI00191618A8|nr:flagellar hook-basal body protein [Hydrogenimonas urashimensis]
MQNGFYSVTGGMVTQFNRLDQISHNLANVRTNGYKGTDVVIGDFMRLFQRRRDELPLPNQTKEGAKFLNRSINRVPRIVERFTDFRMGAMVHTGNPLDVALDEKNLFFAVETPSGIRLTRDGAFRLNEHGELMTRDGFKVLSRHYFQNHQAITVPVDAININIGKSGRIEYMDKTAMDTPVYLDDLMVVRVDNLQDLEAEGDNYFTMPGKRLEKEMNIVTETSGVYQYMIEKSNVNPIREMTALIETNRLVEMYQKAMTAQMDDMNNDAITKLASVRA